MDNLVHSFLYKFPLVWNSDCSTLTFQPTTTSFLLYILNLFNAIILALACAYNLFTWHVMKRTDYNIGIASLHIIGIIVLLGMLALTLCVARNNECVSGLNSIIREPVTTNPRSKRELTYFIKLDGSIRKK